MQVDASTRYLCASQLAELFQETPCAECGVYPEGPIAVDGIVVLAVRCPRATCRAPSRVRQISLDNRALQALVRLAPDGDFGGSVDRLLLNSPSLEARRSADGPVRPVSVRLGPSSHFRVRGLSVTELSEIVASFLDQPQ